MWNYVVYQNGNGGMKFYNAYVIGYISIKERSTVMFSEQELCLKVGK